ncbi:hypothetical protein [Acinetobacter ursingii]|uniref:hypothetical protein n=1 Tax=Acinetobacter ursingii TaxID=108980 RepID=UPI0012507365|nr:hypothetical protein [Acinetobacter ursingii]
MMNNDLNPLNLQLNHVEMFIQELQPTFDKYTANPHEYLSLSEDGIALEITLRSKANGSTRTHSYNLRDLKILRDQLQQN